MRVFLCFCVAVLLGFCNTANADVVSGATVLNAPPPNSGGFETTVDQSGLTLGYVSGVTDYDVYAASLPRHEESNTPFNYGGTSNVNSPKQVDYDLGSSLTITRLAFWQYPFATFGPLRDFDVFTTNDPTFTNSSFVGNFTALDDGPVCSHPA